MDGLLALLIAESALNPYAERWGKRTREAQMALEREDWTELQHIIDDVAPDLSFGYSQRIVLYHWWGDGRHTIDNVLSVRKATFHQPDRDILEAAFRYRQGWDAAASYGNMQMLMAMVHYNAGYIPPPDSYYWIKYQGNVTSYLLAIERARKILENGGGVE